MGDDGGANDVAEIIRDLAQRVRYLEDRQAIVDLMTSYGPAIDAGDADAVIRVWTSDGVYDVDTGVMHGHGEIIDMVRGEMHQGFVRAGCAHILEPGSVVVDGDSAVATAKSLLVVKEEHGSGFTVLRATANRWEMVKTGGRWKCRRRIGRLLDGRAAARRLLAGELEGLDDAR